MREESSRQWAMITGGSSGIGLAFAKEFAKKGENLVLVSRGVDELRTAQEELEGEFSGVLVEILAADLAKPEDLAKIGARIANDEKPISILVNSAGFVLHESSIFGDVARQEAAIEVMQKAVLILSRTAAREFLRREKLTKNFREISSAKIINIASVSASLYAGNYSAIKNWVVSFSQSLALELDLAKSRVRAMAICPGETRTNFHENGGLRRPEIPKFLWCEPEEVAKESVRFAEKISRKKLVGNVIFVPTWRWRTAMFLMRHFRVFARGISRGKLRAQAEEMREKNLEKSREDQSMKSYTEQNFAKNTDENYKIPRSDEGQK